MGIDIASTRGGAKRSHELKFFPVDSKAGARMRGTLSDALERLAADVQQHAMRSACYAGARFCRQSC